VAGGLKPSHLLGGGPCRNPERWTTALAPLVLIGGDIYPAYTSIVEAPAGDEGPEAAAQPVPTTVQCDDRVRATMPTSRTT
jgi:hypothetical protein